eukprot:2884082-Rhodomonas_salina.8
MGYASTVEPELCRCPSSDTASDTDRAVLRPTYLPLSRLVRAQPIPRASFHSGPLSSIEKSLKLGDVTAVTDLRLLVPAWYPILE